ncbi:unnamed protein product [Sphenostylis stenocarpa]|uniref:AIPP2-like SPOC-like domain-containing protein n=1 Tax=Sphenostylis stenocarpa TaxID=92480 RepID=A0AA86S8Q0_9FABA|nr:unnamed protein product [Sphenostylis stenocarpa]
MVLFPAKRKIPLSLCQQGKTVAFPQWNKSCGPHVMGQEEDLAICSKCTDGAEHIYCMADMLDKVPEGDWWMCEDCKKSERQKSRSPVHLESSGSSKLNSKSFHDWKRQTGTRSYSSANMHGVHSEAQSLKEHGVTEMNAKACDNTLLPKDFSCKTFKNGKAKETKDTTSELQISCIPQDKSKVPLAYSENRLASTLEVELDKKRKALETRAELLKASKPTNESLLSRESPSKKLGNTNVKQSSYGSQKSSELDSHSGSPLFKPGLSEIADVKFKGQQGKVGYLPMQNVEKNIAMHDTRKGGNLGLLSKSVSFDNASLVKLNGTGSEVIVEDAYPPVVFKNSSSAEDTKTTKGKHVSGVVAAKSKNRTTSCNKTSLSGSNHGRLDAVQGCGQVDPKLQPNSPKAHKNLICLDKDKKNENWQDGKRTEAVTVMKLHELCNRHGCDKKSQFEAANLPEDFPIPSLVYTWNGMFLIHRVEGIVSTRVGMQAYVSTCASEEVLAVVGRLPDIVVLEELPLLKMWPSQSVESQATEENIAVYFFEKDFHRELIEYMSKNDLALKANLNGLELQIFPSNVLPGKLQCWNKLLFLWGVFREHTIDDSANTLVQNYQKRKNRDIVSSSVLDLNVNPHDGINMVGDHEIGEFDAMHISSSGDRIVLGGVDNYNSGCPDSRKSQHLDGQKETPGSVRDLKISRWPKNATLEVGACLSVENVDVDDQPSKHGKLKRPTKENNNADNVKPHGKLPRNERGNTDRPESLASPTNHEENLKLLYWQAVEILSSKFGL